MSIFNPGKANARILELEGQLAASKSETKTVSDNATAVEAEAERISNESDKKASDHASAILAKDAEITRLTAKVKEQEAAVAASAEKVKGIDAEVEKLASAKAREITASMGIVGGVKFTPESDPGQKTSTENLKGRERLTAEFKAQIDSQKLS